MPRLGCLEQSLPPFIGTPLPTHLEPGHFHEPPQAEDIHHQSFPLPSEQVGWGRRATPELHLLGEGVRGNGREAQPLAGDQRGYRGGSESVSGGGVRGE